MSAPKYRVESFITLMDVKMFIHRKEDASRPPGNLRENQNQRFDYRLTAWD
jgi:hypothetical protein